MKVNMQTKDMVFFKSWQQAPVGALVLMRHSNGEELTGLVADLADISGGFTDKALCLVDGESKGRLVSRRELPNQAALSLDCLYRVTLENAVMSDTLDPVVPGSLYLIRFGSSETAAGMAVYLGGASQTNGYYLVLGGPNVGKVVLGENHLLIGNLNLARVPSERW